ncbi:MAG: prepilin-type N-terminal cleavage/methylation domain-containing protein [Candidatus Sumerlaeaceae bacterium]|nr:prepilin-type N-terminal cleavage/methylation domain-containing protein [Candidatus Sumerlaeaceae bacterium]
MRKAFTLIELLIVVAIIAILAAIAVPNFLEAQTRSKVARAKADMRSLATAIESYTVDNNKPPTVIVLGKTSSSSNPFGDYSIVNTASTAANCVSARFKRLTTPVAYITSVFVDPFRPQGYGVNPAGQLNVEYDTYDYFEAYDFTPGTGSYDQTTPNWRGAGITSGANWRVVSAGPDRVNFFGGGYAGQFPMPDRSFGLDYDPTNGTVSRGDIVRVSSAAGPINAPARLPSIDRIKNVYNDTF